MIQVRQMITQGSSSDSFTSCCCTNLSRKNKRRPGRNWILRRIDSSNWRGWNEKTESGKRLRWLASRGGHAWRSHGSGGKTGDRFRWTCRHPPPSEL